MQKQLNRKIRNKLSFTVILRNLQIDETNCPILNLFSFNLAYKEGGFEEVEKVGFVIW